MEFLSRIYWKLHVTSAADGSDSISARKLLNFLVGISYFIYLFNQFCSLEFCDGVVLQRTRLETSPQDLYVLIEKCSEDSMDLLWRAECVEARLCRTNC